MPAPHIRTAAARPQGAGAAGARPRGHLAVLSARLSVRHGQGARRGSLGRGWQPLSGLHERHRACAAPGTRTRRSCRRSRTRRTTSCTSRSDYWHERMTRLAERINALDPLREPAQVLVCQSGTEAVEGRAEARALRDRAAALHRFPRRLSRPHHGLARLHLQQVHPAGRILPDHAGRHARALPERLPSAVRRRRPGPGGPRLHRERAVPEQRAGERGRRDPGRADPGRRRLSRAAGRLPRRACGSCATGTGSC